MLEEVLDSDPPIEPCCQRKEQSCADSAIESCQINRKGVKEHSCWEEPGESYVAVRPATSGFVEVSSLPTSYERLYLNRYPILERPREEVRPAAAKIERAQLPPQLVESGPLSREYEKKFRKKDKNHLRIPKKPVKMDWFEEPELARTLYEMMQAEEDYEQAKQNLALKSDFNL